MIKSEILVPLLNVNEPEARLVAVHVNDGQAVEKGDRLFTIETTKAASDIEASESGFIRVLVEEGAILAVGDRLALIADDPTERVELKKSEQAPASSQLLNDSGELRITMPARKLAYALGVTLTELPTDRLITEEFIRNFTLKEKEVSLAPSDKPYILVYGAGGHAKSIMEIIQQNGTHTIAGIVDDDLVLSGKSVLGINVLGTRSLLTTLFEKGIRLAANGVGGILDINIRIKVFELLEKNGFTFPALIHPRAAIEPSAMVKEGVQVFANAYVGSEAKLHPRCMINTNSVVSHDCEIGEYTHIAPGALLAGHVHVGARSLVGMGVTTAIGVQIGAGVRIGNGAIILADVPDSMIIQAGRFWTGKANIR